MKLESVFQYSIYAMIALAGAMLAYGEETPFPSALTVLLAWLALSFNERNQRLRIPALVSNILGLAALGVAVVEFFGKREDSKLLAGAHFLVYITWIVLFQTKELRHYWWLCALSLLQVAIGPLLTMSTGWYGVLLFLYLLLAIWTLSVFTLYQGAFEFGVVTRGRHLVRRGNPSAPRGSSGPPADSLSTMQKVFARERRSLVRNAIQQDSPGRWIVPRFVATVLGLSLAGLSLGLVMFLFVPRVKFGPGARSQGEGRTDGQPVTGFSSEIRLGQMGQILESTERVMEVGLYEYRSDRPLDLDEFAQQHGFAAPFFRGNVLDLYGKGRWSTGRRDDRPNIMASWPRVKGMIRQEYTIDLHGSDILFAMSPFELACLDPYQTVSVDTDTDVLTTQVEGRDQVTYLVYSKPRQAPGAPGGPIASGSRLRRPRSLARILERCRRLPSEGVERLIGLARELTVPENLVGDEQMPVDLRMALTLEAHLRDSGSYAYSLNMAVDDPERDPIEDFLFNRKRGHCEYFASSLALMLRAVQIPSRLVTGFKGADPIGNEGRYEVQQCHAHAWVEAFVDNGWRVLDATPGARDESVRVMASRAGFWKNARSSISSLWSNYVVSLSLNRQQHALYDPLQGSVSTGWGSVRGALQQVAAAVAWIKQAISSPEELFTPRGGGVLLLIALAAIAVVKIVPRLLDARRRSALRLPRQNLISRLLGWIADWFGGRRRDPVRIVVAFYEQFQALVSAAGLIPRPNQTPREFAHEVEGALVERLSRAGLVRFPSDLSELFYRVRFGAEALEPLETLEIEHRLQRLKESLVPAPRSILPTARLAKADIES